MDRAERGVTITPLSFLRGKTLRIFPAVSFPPLWTITRTRDQRY
jgi:hypothetical protein